MYIRLIAAAIVTVAVAGCQTGAQKKQQAMLDNVAAARAATEPCFAEVESHPEFQGILAKMPPRGNESPPLAMLANQDRPTDAEIAALYAFHQAQQPCRKIALESVGRIHPAVVSVFVEGYSRLDREYVRLVRRESCWGDFAQAREALKTELAAKLQAVGDEIDRQLANEQTYELQQRQQASERLMQWSAQQQLLYQQQQYLNRPKLTSCDYQGHFLNCTTQ